MTWASHFTCLSSVPQLHDGGDGPFTAGLRQRVTALWKQCSHGITQHSEPLLPRQLCRGGAAEVPPRPRCAWPRGPALAVLERLRERCSAQGTSPSPLLTACSKGPGLHSYFYMSLNFFSPLNLVFLFRNQHMTQPASSKFSVALRYQECSECCLGCVFGNNSFYLSTFSNSDCLLGSFRKEFVISFPPNDEMLPAQVPEAQPEPDAGGLSLCLIKQYHPQDCAFTGSLQGFWFVFLTPTRGYVY